jgi:hypothetical protein
VRSRTRAEASAVGAVANTGRIDGPINVNPQFGAGSVLLDHAVKNVRSVNVAVELDRFTGRGWLVRQLDDALARLPDGGYIWLEAEAGVGKTAFSAWLVRERGYPYHFAVLGTAVSVGLLNLAGQLVRRYGLEGEFAPGGRLHPGRLRGSTQPRGPACNAARGTPRSDR